MAAYKGFFGKNIREGAVKPVTVSLFAFRLVSYYLIRHTLLSEERRRQQLWIRSTYDSLAGVSHDEIRHEIEQYLLRTAAGRDDLVQYEDIYFRFQAEVAGLNGVYGLDSRRLLYAIEQIVQTKKSGILNMRTPL